MDETITRALIKYARMINTLTMVAADHVRVLERRLTRCAVSGCQNAATVRHASMTIGVCDHCAAEAIVKDACLEELFIDLPDADQIRRIADHAALLRQGEIPDTTPLDQRRLH